MEVVGKSLLGHYLAHNLKLILRWVSIARGVAGTCVRRVIPNLRSPDHEPPAMTFEHALFFFFLRLWLWSRRGGVIGTLACLGNRGAGPSGPYCANLGVLYVHTLYCISITKFPLSRTLGTHFDLVEKYHTLSSFECQGLLVVPKSICNPKKPTRTNHQKCLCPSRQSHMLLSS